MAAVSFGSSYRIGPDPPEELFADQVVEAHLLGDFAGFDTELLANVPNVVDESEIGREARIVRVVHITCVRVFVRRPGFLKSLGRFRFPDGGLPNPRLLSWRILVVL